MEMPNCEKGEAIFEIAENEKLPFFTAYTYAFQEDRNLSLQAKGLLAMLLSFGRGWQIYMRDIQKRSTSGRYVLRGAVKELCACGYLVKKSVKGSRGRFSGWSYTVYQRPQTQEKSASNGNAIFQHAVKQTSRGTECCKPVDVKYIQPSNIDNCNTDNNNVVAVIDNLKKMGMTKAAINEITAVLDEKTIITLLKYASENNLGPGWIRSAARDPAKRPPKTGSEAATVREKEIKRKSIKPPDPDCPMCHGQGGWGEEVPSETLGSKTIWQVCDCIHQKRA